ncbi:MULTISPECIES: dTDP-4-dehydrorhamnose 3,5-epimerase [unclassified Paenibacillus]|uniref:dTDP-4-dehydrorhamnose 3,5-epimerase n=1 Tax=unclassified Paenibacillus TaxID=185978 RepID=UPI000956710D|nr:MULTISPECIES: dTDP-4-dehydrorhamnose 3,5-epimerase [unclassified Paenibacillus]ASS68722.1 dTDP-4-dehydrorhamnose 3,5-epimerase [Paenibacillus sp. RUD330]SIR56344.1 dTDP-4-dehydrorhamnose 3,5-epimerase [Paenibacillus sp. RU4X]SIR65004.1 dTDP-4-dehydrorhamnose 3,5-epimerase [Paenibacillus sp. RU4T]
MKIIPSKLEGVLIVETDVFGDNRGFFTESYNEEKFRAAGIEHNFIQDNHSLSQEAGTLRGLHYQLNPKAQTKLVRAISGAIYDVVVDLRKSSATYGQWQGFILSEANKRQLLVPRGFAHGFCTLVSNTQVVYKVDEYYSKEHDRGILWNDPALGIDWPTDRVVLSDKDKIHPGIHEAEHNF